MAAKFVIALSLLALTAAPASVPTVQRYRDMCDASAAIMLNARTFLVANDEDNVLRVYRVGQPEPIGRFDLTTFLHISEDDEADIEGAAAIGTRVYWITSHGTNNKGKPRPARRRLFATDVSLQGDKAKISPFGAPYLDLVADLGRLTALAPYQIIESAGVAPEKGGLNIEGLAAQSDGTLLIGLRSPLANGQAAIVPIFNPAEVVVGKAARLGTPIPLNLGGLGIRSLERAGDGRGYIVAAGPVAKGPLHLYRWVPEAKPPLVPLDIGLAGLAPEAVAAKPGAVDRLLLLSDDGEELVAGVECKDAAAEQRSFRGAEVRIDR